MADTKLFPDFTPLRPRDAVEGFDFYEGEEEEQRAIRAFLADQPREKLIEIIAESWDAIGNLLIMHDEAIAQAWVKAYDAEHGPPILYLNPHGRSPEEEYPLHLSETARACWVRDRREWQRLAAPSPRGQMQIGGDVWTWTRG